MLRVAGTLLWDPSGTMVLLLKRPNGNWDLPKGGLEHAETPVQAAIRETKEETGIDPILTGTSEQGHIGDDEMWLFGAKSSNLKVQISHEHTAYEWAPFRKALAMLYPPLAKIASKMERSRHTEGREMFEEREQNPDGSTSCGIFLPLPYNIAREFQKKPEDDSVPHFTLLYAGDLSPRDYRKFVKVVRKICRNIEPFPMDVSHYSEFENNKKQRIPHMRPGCLGSSIMARVHGLLRRAVEASGIKLAHNYGPNDNSSVPYEVRFKPHATLAYQHKLDGPYKGSRPTGTWTVTELECWGHERICVPLGKTKVDQPLGLTRGLLSGKYPRAFCESETWLEAISDAEELKRRADELRKKVAARDPSLVTKTRLKPKTSSLQRQSLHADEPSEESKKKKIALGKMLRAPLLLLRVTRKTPLVKVRRKIKIDKPKITAAKITIRPRKVEEAETSLKGHERHSMPAGTGPSMGGIGPNGTLEYLKIMQDQDKKLQLRRTKLQGK